MRFQLPLLTTGWTRHLAIASVIAVAGVLAACSDDPATKSDPTTAESPADKLKSFDIAKLMEPGPMPENILGKDDAPVTIIEYSSLTCPHCASFHKDILPTLKQKYVDTGKARYILREFPLDNRAAAAFVLARCVGTGERYFTFVDVLYEKQAQWAFVQGNPLPELLKFARQAGMTEQAFNTCLANQEMLNGMEIIRSRASEEFEVNSTPSFFVNGKQIKGGLPIEEFEAIIDSMLKG